MDPKSIPLQLSSEQQDTYNKSTFIQRFINFMKNYLKFIVLFALFIDCQIHLILKSPHSNEVLEMLLVMSFCSSISGKMIQSIYYYILLAFVFGIVIVSHYCGLSTTLWILLFSVLLALKLNSIFKKKITT
ncbi:MAG TPA: hypothetical protein P5545_02145 [Bacteroidota bacterium]|nr:hypothetical protein [Candidatus Kapabacteria bacterium]HRS01329.1 hypothetical protein [Bacteroidota bacterium]